MSPADPHETPRRLPRRARRDQLVAAAMPLLARRGPAELSLGEVAERVGVTRNLLYHYFPGGRDDLLAAVVREAERQLLGPRISASPRRISETSSGSPGLQEPLSRLLDHALAPTHAWRIHRLARAAVAPELAAIVRGSTEAIVEILIPAGPRRDQPAPLTEVALHGYVSFAEAILDGARAAGVCRSEVRSLLDRTLRAVLAAA